MNNLSFTVQPDKTLKPDYTYAPESLRMVLDGSTLKVWNDTWGKDPDGGPIFWQELSRIPVVGDVLELIGDAFLVVNARS